MGALSPVWPLMGCMISEKPAGLSGPQFPHLHPEKGTD